eukprot:CAMPEP_0174231344 /NCGR_PEP_ID=MMETSP0417-20130205/1891_1 /TAXON_ID=242541 /ORGANISM="Mayorella sp, Strain BSH-02190019" /LENGTH=1210 /DNA_ID=CAMNT_0015309213 /DNA_START=169 /DNA_END=3801 /DNA_ORIENTATION=+
MSTSNSKSTKKSSNWSKLFKATRAQTRNSSSLPPSTSHKPIHTAGQSSPAFRKPPAPRASVSGSLSEDSSPPSPSGSSPLQRVATTDLNLDSPEFMLAGVFGQQDSPETIIFEESTSSGKGSQIQSPELLRIKNATLIKLIERVTYPAYPDPKYLLAFLLTYRSFTTGAEILDLLEKRWNCEPHSGARTPDFESKFVQRIRLRVLNVVKVWISKHTYDFRDDIELTKRVIAFLDDVVAKDMRGSADGLKKSLERRLEAEDSREIHLDEKKMELAPTPKVPPMKRGALTLLDMNPLEVARQITLIEFRLYNKCRPWEFLGLAWTRNAGQDAPNVHKMIHWSTRMSLWVATEILRGKTAKKKIAVISMFIKIAKYLRKLNNFNGLMEIMAGFENSAVHRLRPYWDAVPKAHMELFENVKDIMSNSKNFAAFRTFLKQVDPPCIPYIGMYLTDLTFMEEGIPDNVGDLINFSKRWKVAAVIQDIQQYQQAPYHLHKLGVIQDYLTNAQALDNETMYKISLECMPRGAAKELTLRELEEQQKSKGVDSSQLADQERDSEMDYGELDGVKDNPFYQGDSSENILLDSNARKDSDPSTSSSGSDTSVRGASLPKLIERLTGVKPPSAEFLESFLLMWSTFATPKEIFQLLKLRYNVPLPKNPTSEILSKYVAKVQFPIQLRVFNLLKVWQEKYPRDLTSDPELLALFRELVSFIQEDSKMLGTRAERVLESLEEKETVKLPALPPVDPKISASLVDLSSIELVQQLTIMEQHKFQQLTTANLERYLRLGPEKESDLHAWAVQRQQDMKLWFMWQIVMLRTKEMRAKLIETLLTTAIELLEFRNYFSASYVLAALQSPEVTSLKKSWALLPKGAPPKMFALRTVSEHLRKHATFYKHILPLDSRFSLPCIPPMHIYLNALQEIYDTLPDYIGENSNLINFEKAKRLSALLSQIHKFQSKPFGNLVASPRPAAVLHNCTHNLQSYERFVDKVLELQAAEAGDVVARRATMNMIRRETAATSSTSPGTGSPASRFNRTGSFKIPLSPPPQPDPAAVEAALAETMLSCVPQVCSSITEAADIQESVDESSNAMFSNTVPLTDIGLKRFRTRCPEAVDELEVWSRDDPDGEVLGWPSTISLNVCNAPTCVFVVFELRSITKARLSKVMREVEFYKVNALIQQEVETRVVVLTRSISPELASVARNLQILCVAESVRPKMPG